MIRIIWSNIVFAFIFEFYWFALFFKGVCCYAQKYIISKQRRTYFMYFVLTFCGIVEIASVDVICSLYVNVWYNGFVMFCLHIFILQRHSLFSHNYNRSFFYINRNRGSPHVLSPAVIVQSQMFIKNPFEWEQNECCQTFFVFLFCNSFARI